MPASNQESIDFSNDERVELHLFWNTTDHKVDVAVYFDNLPVDTKVELDGPPVMFLTPLKTVYNFKLVPESNSGSFLYFDDEIYGKPHEVEAIISQNNNSKASTTAILN